MKDSPCEYILDSPATAPENSLMAPSTCRGTLRWKPQEKDVLSTSASIPSVETEVIEPEGGRKRHTGVASEGFRGIVNQNFLRSEQRESQDLI